MAQAAFFFQSQGMTATKYEIFHREYIHEKYVTRAVQNKSATLSSLSRLKLYSLYLVP